MISKLYCAICRKETEHKNIRHHSGEYLAQCQTCFAFKPFRVTAQRRKNPVPPSSKATGKTHRHVRDQAERAKLLYTNFTGHEAGDEVMIDKPQYPDVMSVIGDIDGLLYTTVRDGKVEKYIHKFKKNSRPLFCIAPDGLTLYMIGGSYEFGERGIVDK